MKLETLLGLYYTGLPVDLTENLRTFWPAWNAGSGPVGVRKELERQLPEWCREAQRWADRQGMRPDLAARLVQFYVDWL